MTYYQCHVEPCSVTVAREVALGFSVEPPWVVLSEDELAILRQRVDSIPAVISARQARLWLVRHGIGLAQVDAAISSIADPIARESCRVEWEYGTEVHRDSEWLAALGPALGLDGPALDAALREAANL